MPNPVCLAPSRKTRANTSERDAPSAIRNASSPRSAARRDRPSRLTAPWRRAGARPGQATTESPCPGAPEISAATYIRRASSRRSAAGPGLIEANTCRSAGMRSPGRPLERTCTVIDELAVCCGANDRYTCGGDDSSSRSNRYLPLAATPTTVAGPKPASIVRPIGSTICLKAILPQNECLIDDDDWCAVGGIALVNRAAGLETVDPHRVEIAPRDPVGKNRHALVFRGDVAGHLDVLADR